jgi:DNA-binding NarL/FixJ family response regulator
MTENNDTIRNFSVVIADDHQIIRSALSELLAQLSLTGEQFFEIKAYAENGLEALALVKQRQPDCLFLDISMPLATGVEIIHDIQRWSPRTKIIIFTGVTSSGMIVNAVQAGIDGLFNKGASVDAIIENLPFIMQGARYIAPEFLAIIEQATSSSPLTARELQILNMLLKGKTNKEIAHQLNISPKTVDKHRTSIMTKLNVHSISQLMTYALKEGLIDASP